MEPSKEREQQAFEAAKRGNRVLLQQFLEESPELIGSLDERGRTLLHVAAYAEGDQADIVYMLISRGANTEAVDNDGWKPADWADFAVHQDVMLLLIGPRSSGA